jgi:glycosyltransferase involved in cell wall biosynthesis
MSFTKRDDIEVIHNAIDPGFETKLKDESKPPYNVLFIGANPNKNLERTVLALKDIPCKLTIIGKLNQEQIDFLIQSGIDYIVKSGLSDEEMIREYEDCDIVSFISLFEGFGMIVIEANKVGRPVIASTIPVLHEVGGDSAVYVDPYDEGSIRKGFLTLFSDSILRKDCVENGLKNVKRFDHKYITEKYLNLYSAL